MGISSNSSGRTLRTAFSAPAWRSRQVYYQIFPERFKNGDAPRRAQKLGALRRRGRISWAAIWRALRSSSTTSVARRDVPVSTPIFRAPSNHKYDTADYFEIDPAFGTKDDLRRLVDGVHARGMRILLDGVFNHCGYWWDKFQDVVKNGEASPYRSWFFIHSYPVDAGAENYDCVGHYKWMPKLNLANPDARDYFLSVGRYWLEEFGIDGWRLDVADELPTAFLEAFAAAMRACKPDCILLGETWGDAGRLEREPARQRDELSLPRRGGRVAGEGRAFRVGIRLPPQPGAGPVPQ